MTDPHYSFAKYSRELATCKDGSVGYSHLSGFLIILMMKIHQDQLIEWDKLLIQQYISLLPPEI